MKKNLFTLLLFIQLACMNTSDKSLLITLPKQDILVGEKSESVITTKLPGGIEYTKTGLIVLNPFDDNEFLQLYDLASFLYIKGYGKLGKGPGELITPTLANADVNNSNVFIYDPNLKKFCIINVNDSGFVFKRIYNLINIITFNHSFLQIESNQFVTMGYNEQHSIILADTSGKVLSEYPINFVNNLNHTIGAFMDYNSENKILVLGFYDIGYISAYKIENSKITPLWDHYLSLPVLKDNKLDIEKSISGFREVHNTGKYIYALYKGKIIQNTQMRSKEAIPDNLIVFSLDGKPVKNYKLSEPLIRMTVDEQTNTIYGITLDIDYKFVKYNLR